MTAGDAEAVGLRCVTMNFTLELMLILVAIALNGFFAASEFALVSSRISRLTSLPTAGASLALRLKQSPDTFLATVQIGITLVGTLASAVGGATAVDALTPLLRELGLGEAAQPVALGLVILALTYLSLVLGELVPKAVALRNPEGLAVFVAPSIYALSRISAGVVRALTASTNAVLRLVGLGGDVQSPFTSEEDVRYLLREGTAKGIFETTEEQLIHKVFEYADTTVREVMVPRPSIRGIDVTTPSAEIVRRAASIGHSRIPVYRDDINQPVGILWLSDLLRALASNRPLELAALLHPPVFVPENTKISTVLRRFQQEREHLGLVVDEYGSVVGLITVEDILEQLVGDIGETDAAGRAVRRLPDGTLLADGLASIDELRSAGIAVPESSDYTTAAGFIMTTLGAVPKRGSTVSSGSHRWTVMEADGPRVRKIRIEPR
jgi:putative hemolysin